MEAGHFVEIFDVSAYGFRYWVFPSFGLIFVAAGVMAIVLPGIIRAAGIPNMDFKPRTSRFQALFPYFFMAFGLLWSILAFSTTWSRYLHNKELVEQNRCRVAEGPVERFVPMPYAGHAQESFSVAGVPFSYSDFMLTGGFNDTSSHGGPIRSDSYVRICYDPIGNIILRLEIRDFEGVPKDYSKLWLPFPAAAFSGGGADSPHMPDLPRYGGGLFMLFFLLDTVGIYALFTPYLRTFFRVRTMPPDDVPLPEPLGPGTKIRLHNSMIYRDAETGTIWLRPRGLNLLKVPLVVGRMNTDGSGRSISRIEIRFSSGFPFATAALLLWTVHLFSVAMPRGPAGPSPALVAGVVAVMMLAACFINVRTIRARMALVIDDAVSELKGM